MSYSSSVLLSYLLQRNLQLPQCAGPVFPPSLQWLPLVVEVTSPGDQNSVASPLVGLVGSPVSATAGPSLGDRWTNKTNQWRCYTVLLPGLWSSSVNGRPEHPQLSLDPRFPHIVYHENGVIQWGKFSMECSLPWALKDFLQKLSVLWLISHL